MIRPLAIASLLFASQAMAGESIVIPAQPYTLKCLEQYQTIENCIKGLVEVSHRLTIELQAMKAKNAPEPKVKPAPEPAKTVKRTGCRKQWRTLKNGRKKYRCV